MRRPRGGLIGHPVAHSRSPELFRRLSRLLREDFRYVAVDLEPRALERGVRRLAARGWSALGVTRPHKRAVIPLLDRLTPQARGAGAVNAVAIRGGLWIGHNTDAEGFADALRRLGARVRGQDAVVFGAGGAARAAAWALGRLGARVVTICARRRSAARALAADMSALFTRTRFRAAGPRKAALWVNATPLGWRDGDPSPGGKKALCAAALDMVYGRDTAFLRQARAAQAAACDGLPMLVFQAVRAWEFWIEPLGAARRRDLAEELLRQLEGGRHDA